jgi:hypothetical protein
MRFRGLVLSLVLLSVASVSAGAVEPPAGSRNFVPPTSVPNYFSGEAGAIQGVRPAPMPGTTYAQPTAPRARIAVAAPRQLSRRMVRGRDGHYRFFVTRGRGGGHDRYARSGRGHVRQVAARSSGRRVARR